MRIGLKNSLLVLAVAGGPVSMAVAQDTVVAIDLRAATNRVITFPSNAPALNVVGTTVFNGFAMDFNADATVLYGIDNPVATLGTIDETTGTYSPLFNISGDGAAEANWAGLSLDPTTGIMWGLAGGNMYHVDLATGNTTFIAAMSGPAGPVFIDFAFDVNGNLFAHDIVSDSLYSVDKVSGVATLLGPTGFLANFAQGMDFDWGTNTLYAHIYVGGGVAHYASLDTTTGAATIVLTTTPWNAEMEIAVKSAVPTGGCYANCDNSTTEPVLNVADFSCFLQEFAQGTSYANCDGSTTEPVLNVADFSCFLQEFAGGCD